MYTSMVTWTVQVNRLNITVKFEENWYEKENMLNNTFKSIGRIENFDGIEQIYKDNNLIYELHCSGGLIK